MPEEYIYKLEHQIDALAAENKQLREHECCGAERCMHVGWSRTELLAANNIILNITAENKRLREERDRYKAERDELMEMIRIIPCTCHEGFKGRNLTDPDCPRCNWIYEDLITRIQEGGGNQSRTRRGDDV